MDFFTGDIVQPALEGALVLTVNDRLARHLRGEVDRRMSSLGRTAWRTPRILSFDHWLLRTAAGFGIVDRMLTSEQAQFLWESVIEEDLLENGVVLMRAAEAAQQAQKAHLLLAQYHATFTVQEAGEDHRAFWRWREKWQAACNSGKWDDPARLSELLGRELTIGLGNFPAEIVVAGFDDMTPAAVEILAILQKRGCQVRMWAPAGLDEAMHGRIGCQDMVDEVRCCARWIRRLLEEGNGRIGVVAPELDAYRSLVERIFREELAPDSLLPGGEGDKAFNLSLGSPLAEEGMVVAALEILSLGSSISLDQISFLLRSPFVWGHLAEQHSRGIFDSELRRLRMREIPLEKVIRLARRGFKKGIGRSDIFAQFLETVALGLEERAHRTPGLWARYFAGMLEALRWPGDRTLDSREYQVYGAFKEILGTMESFDCIAKPVGRSQALSLLRRLAVKKVFQAEGSEGRVQVMGTLEVAGLVFDHLWVLGMHEDAFPPQPRPNPFLPPGLQRRCGMPRADAARELQFAQKVSDRLLKASSEVVISYPRQSEGQSLQVSPLFKHLEEIQPALADGRHPAAFIGLHAPRPETLIDEAGPAIANGKKIVGGTAILKDQALCPFRAYARHRLKAEGLVSGAVGLDGLDRGSLVHDSLESFWIRTGDIHSLRNLSEQALRERIGECVAKALQKLEKDRQIPLPEGLKENETRRVILLLGEWLEVEKQRTDFKIECLETWHRANLGQLSIQTRIDRIDRLADGSRIIIDYKTGRPGIQDWLGERPVEPQLPLYGLGQDEKDLAAVAFARVRSANCAFVGVAREKDLLPGIPGFSEHRALQEAGIGEWRLLLEGWKTSLLKLSEEFAGGQAAVAPIDRTRACDRCDLHPLCRINEQVRDKSGEE